MEDLLQIDGDDAVGSDTPDDEIVAAKKEGDDEDGIIAVLIG